MMDDRQIKATHYIAFNEGVKDALEGIPCRSKVARFDLLSYEKKAYILGWNEGNKKLTS